MEGYIKETEECKEVLRRLQCECPPQITQFMKEFESKRIEWLKHHRSHTREALECRKNIIERAPKETREQNMELKDEYDNIVWTLDNLEIIVRTEVLLANVPQSVYAARVNNGDCTILVWLDINQLAQVDVSQKFLEDFLIPEKLAEPRFIQKEHSAIGKYERREVVLETTFVRAKYLASGHWQVKDLSGCDAILHKDWASDIDNGDPFNFEEIKRYCLKEYAEGKVPEFTLISEGCTKEEEYQRVSKGLVPLFYVNRDGHRDCMVASLCSALYYLGYQRKAADIFHAMTKQGGSTSRELKPIKNLKKPRTLLNVLQDTLQAMDIPWHIASTRKKKILSIDSIKAAIKSGYILLGSIRGRNSVNNHCVAFAGGNCIFDPNQSHVHLITKKSLTEACDGAEFAGLRWGIFVAPISP